ncbi:o-succinylbenzoate--CoA ligase [[Haemophilus] felis]|nr:o-succinylbenzoate--CoA ligase [[Haemophilus] felis]
MFPWQQFALQSEFMNRIALRYAQGEVFTWQQLSSRINFVASQLVQQGITLKDSQHAVALCGKNDVNLLLLYLACIQLGVKVVVLNPALSLDKIQQYCQQANVQFFYAAHQLNLANISSLHIENSERFCEFQTLFSHEADFYRPATMTLTSGSTGQAKAVVHNLHAHLANAIGVCELMQFTAQDSWLLSLPLYHVSGQGIVWRWLTVGATLHLAEDDFYLSASQTTHLSLVPTQLQRLLNYWQQNPNLNRCTQHILLGGSHIPVSLTCQLSAFGVQSYSGYGMTEMASTVFAKPSDARAGVGQALRGREYCLVNGEVWLRGAGLAMGYWQNNQLFSLLNEQGWLATKDRAEWRDNELVLLGRLDNMFISGGENIQPEEIEALLLQHGKVKQIVVLPKQDPEFGQRPVAFVEFFMPFSAQLVAELQAWIVDKIERFKQPIAYFPLPIAQTQQDNIKLSRQALQLEFKNLLGITHE